MVDMEAVEAQLTAIRASFIAELPQREQRISDAWQQLQHSEDDHCHSGFLREVHSLAGAGAIFGCDELSQKARAVENRFKPLSGNSDVTTDTELLSLYKVLQDEIHRVVTSSKAE